MLERCGFLAKAALASAVLVSAALVSNTRAAQADTYVTYDINGVVSGVSLGGGAVNLNVTYDTSSTDAAGYDIFSASGTVFGDTVTLAGGNPGNGGSPGPGQYLSPDNLFYYDNVIYPQFAGTGSLFDNNGLLLQDQSQPPYFAYANIFGSPTAGSITVELYASGLNGGYPYSGTLTDDLEIVTPLPSTWLMLISGFVGLGFFVYRGANKNRAALATA